MMDYLKDDAIHLRPLEPSDVDRFFIWQNDASLWCTTNTVAPYSHHAIWEYVNNYVADIYSQRQLHLMVCANGSEEAIGCIDIFDIDPAHRRAMCGLLIDRQHRGKGIGSHAVGLMTSYCRDVLHLHQLCAHISSDNGASLRLFGNQGFTHSGTLRDWLLTPSGYADAEVLQKKLD